MSAASGSQIAPAWSTRAISHLLDAGSCPRCGALDVHADHCLSCGADYSELGSELWGASQRAADALAHRQSVLDRIPVRAADPRQEAPAAAPPAPPAADAPRPDPAPDAASSATVQSVLAVAGAGLVAVAAVVFAFFNPELGTSGLRAAILGVIAALFLGAAAPLTRRGLRFSAEALGGLGVVFVALTATASLPLLGAEIDPLVATALAALAGGGALAAAAVRLRLRVWLWSSLTTLAFVPLLFGSASPEPAGAIAGTLASAGATAALVAVGGRLEARLGARPTVELATLTMLQLAFSVTAGIQSLAIAPGLVAPAFAVSASSLVVAVLAVAAARHEARALWSFVAGVSAVLSGVAGTVGVFVESAAGVWLWALVPTAAVLVLVAVGAARRLHREVRVGFLFAGAVSTVAVVAALPTMVSLVAVMEIVARPEPVVGTPIGPPLAVAAAALCVGLCGFAALTRPGVDGAPTGTAWLGPLGQWYGVLALLLVLTLPELTTPARVAVGLGLGVALASTATLTPLRAARLTVRLPAAVGAHLLVLAAAVVSWQHPETTVVAGAGVVAAAVALARTAPASARFVHTGVGFAYALTVLAYGLDRAALAPVATLALITSAAGVAAIVATFVRRVPARSWYAILAVTAVPFAIGVALVVSERSGWTALSTGVILVLALALTVTRRTGLGTPLRTLAAGLVVPSAAVVAVCLGAQVLEMSGSPVVLPVIAVLVAVVLPSTGAIRRALAARIGERDAAAARLAIEASSLVTAAIAVALALVREAAGAPTALIVLLVLAVGFGAQALVTSRRSAWWLAGAAATGALWSLWSILGFGSIEAHLLPPALGVAIVAVALTLRGTPAPGLFSAGLLAAVAPLVAVQAVIGTDAAQPWRAYGLITCAWILVLAGRIIGGGRPTVRLGALRPAAFTAAIVAASAAPAQGVRWGLGLDAAPGTPLIVWALGLGLIAAAAAATAARLLRSGAPKHPRVRRTRWLAAPATLYATVGVWPTIESSWRSIWIMWALLVAVLTVMVVAAARTLRGGTFLPPVWFLFAIAFVTAVVAWSPRELRVEMFSLPLGAFLVVAGALGLRSDAGRPGLGIRSLSSWPEGRTGSWELLAPGIVVTLSASIAATYTDPQTWRAILVMGLALAAILVGATRRLAAPFVIGVVVLPIENVLAFMVQIGRGIESMPWWITLSVAGAVLLIIAVTYERRAGERAGFAARLRDLR